MPKKRYELAHVEPVMRIDAPWTCGDCRQHRRCSALIGSLRPDAAFCDFAPSRFSLDTIGVLAKLLDEASATMTLHGEPVTGDELRSFVQQEADLRSVPTDAQKIEALKAAAEAALLGNTGVRMWTRWGIPFRAHAREAGSSARTALRLLGLPTE